MFLWGLAVGNAIEVTESLEVLAGGGPADLIELVIALANEMLDIAGIDADPREAITSGRAMDHWRRMVTAQGGDPNAPLPEARHQHVITAPVAGPLSTLEAYGVGVAAWRLGAGRAQKDDEIIHGAGVRLHAKPGDVLSQGQPIMTLLADDEARLPAAIAELEGSWEVGGGPDGSSPADYHPHCPLIWSAPRLLAGDYGTHGLRNLHPEVASAKVGSVVHQPLVFFPRGRDPGLLRPQ